MIVGIWLTSVQWLSRSVSLGKQVCQFGQVNDPPLPPCLPTPLQPVSLSEERAGSAPCQVGSLSGVEITRKVD